MKVFLTALFLAVSAVAAAGQSSQKIDMNSLTCQQVIALPQASLERVAAWVAGYMSDEDEAESMIVDVSEGATVELKTRCQKTPDTKVLRAFDDIDDEGDDEDDDD